MKAFKHTQSEALRSKGHGKRPEPPRFVRLDPRDLLCSFTSMLTEREKIVLHWLAEGLGAREIAERVRKMFPAAIEAPAKAAGAARSLSLNSPSDTSTYNQVPAQHASSMPRQSDAATSGGSSSES